MAVAIQHPECPGREDEYPRHREDDPDRFDRQGDEFWTVEVPGHEDRDEIWCEEDPDEGESTCESEDEGEDHTCDTPCILLKIGRASCRERATRPVATE